MKLNHQIEALLLASDEPLGIPKLRELLGDIESEPVRTALAELENFYAERGIRLVQVAKGWQFRTAPEHSELVQQLWQTRPPRLSRSMLETLAIIAYRQPTTRAEIEALRGVKVSSGIIQGLQERGWVKVLGRKEVPGRPHLYGTGKQFLVDFGLNSLKDLPDSSQLVDEDELIAELAPEEEAAAAAEEENREEASNTEEPGETGSEAEEEPVAEAIAENDEEGR